MKKIILFLLILLLTGCYDYDELNDLAIVSSMLIDYKNGEYSVDLEILTTKENSDKPSYFLEGRGDTFEEAMFNTYNKSTKHIYLSHMFAVILGKNVAEEKMSELYDYFFIDPDVRKDSYFVIDKNIDELLDFKTEDNLSIGETVKNIIHYNEKQNPRFQTSKYSDILHSYLNDTNYLLAGISIDGNMLSVSDTYLMSSEKVCTKIDGDAALFANILKNTPSSFRLRLDEEYEIYKFKTKTEIGDNKISVSLKADVRIIGFTTKKIKDKKSLDEIENEISSALEKLMKKEIEYSLDKGEDIYNFDYLYRKHRPNDYRQGIWKEVEYVFNVDTTLNEKGLLLNNIAREKDEK